MNEFCPLPWININVDIDGQLLPCCKWTPGDIKLPNLKEGRIDELWNGEAFKTIRQKFLDGEKLKECRECWNMEDAGMTSYRQSVRETRWVENGTYSGVLASPPKMYDFMFSNLCNMKCRICTGEFSSLILNENIKLGVTHNKPEHKYWLNSKILETENEPILMSWLTDCKTIQMTGGEPTISSENIKLLDTIIEMGYAKNITFSMNTNAKIVSHKFLDKLEKFNKVRISLSIDDIGKRFEYQRHPSKWTTILGNIDKYIDTSFETIIWCTVSLFNVYYIQELLDWAPCKVKLNALHLPEHYNIKNIPNFTKELLEDKFEGDERLTGIVNFMNQPSDIESSTLIFDALQEIHKLDLHREQSFSTIFPEWYEELNFGV